MHQYHEVIGYVGRAPELKYTNTGKAVTDFNVAVNETWTDDKGNRQEKTTWYRVTAWERLAEICAEYVKRGSLVLVTAKDIKANPYLDKDNKPQASLDITAVTVKFLNRVEGSAQPQMPAPTENDIPF